MIKVLKRAFFATVSWIFLIIISYILNEKSKFPVLFYKKSSMIFIFKWFLLPLILKTVD